MTYEQFFLVNKSLGYYVDRAAYSRHITGRRGAASVDCGYDSNSPVTLTPCGEKIVSGSHILDTIPQDNGYIVFGD